MEKIYTYLYVEKRGMSEVAMADWKDEWEES